MSEDANRETPDPVKGLQGNLARIVLITAAISVVAGLGLLWVSTTQPELFWYGVAITVGGLSLFGYWSLWRGRARAEHP